MAAGKKFSAHIDKLAFQRFFCKGTVYIILLFVVGFNLWSLQPEIRGAAGLHGDKTYHLQLAKSAVSAIKTGNNVTDPWDSTMGTGFAVFHYYQHLPHIVLALIYVSLFESVALIDLLTWSIYFLLSLFPLSVYWSLCRLGFHSSIGVMASLLSSLVGYGFIGGISSENFVFHGWGLYSQLCGLFLLPLMLSVGYEVIIKGKPYLWAVLLCSVTLMSHLVFGYMGFITLGILACIKCLQSSDFKSGLATLCACLRRFVTLLLLVILVTSYFLIPLFLDRVFLNTDSANDTIGKIMENSYGHQVVLQALFTGNLFDLNRIPVLTILVFVGICICVFRWRTKLYLVTLIMFLFWLLLFFGRPTWGNVLNLLPLSQAVHVSRFVAGVHISGIVLAGLALSVLWRWFLSRGRWWSTGLGIFAIILILSPVYIDRYQYLKQNEVAIKETQLALESESADLSNLYRVLTILPAGRVYVADQESIRQDNPYQIGLTTISMLLQSAGFDVFSANYHHYSYSSNLVRIFDEYSHENYNLFNVRYVVAPEEWRPPDFAELIEQFGRHYLYRVETSGYFDLVGTGTEFLIEPREFFDTAAVWIKSNLFLEKHHPEISFESPSKILGSSGYSNTVIYKESTLSDTIGVNSQILPVPLRGSVISEKLGESFLQAEVDVKMNSMLLLKSSYQPNWTANVDGMDKVPVMLMPGFIGVHLEPGRHTVIMQYRARPIRNLLLAVGFLTLLLIALWDRLNSNGWCERTLYNAYRQLVRITRISKNY